MQRRAAAAYFVFFVVLGASAFSVMALAEHPHVDIDGETYSQGDTFSVGDRQYTVSNLGTEGSGGGGGHGGGGGEASYVGALTWTDEDARFTASLANNSTVTQDGQEWHLLVENDSAVDSFVLHERFDVEAILAADPEVENETVTREDGTEYVVYRENGSTQPLEGYLPEPETRRYAEGDDYAYDEENVTATVENVTSSSVEIAWTAPEEHEIELTEGANVTLNDREYVAHFESENAVLLSQDRAGYQQDLRTQDYFTERMNGLKGILILCISVAILLLGMAYLPHRG